MDSVDWTLRLFVFVLYLPIVCFGILLVKFAVWPAGSAFVHAAGDFVHAFNPVNRWARRIRAGDRNALLAVADLRQPNAELVIQSVMPTLIEFLKMDPPYLQKDTIEVFHEIAKTRADLIPGVVKEMLSERLHYGSTWTCLPALRVLAVLGEDMELVKACADVYPEVRREAIHALTVRRSIERAPVKDALVECMRGAKNLQTVEAIFEVVSDDPRAQAILDQERERQETLRKERELRELEEERRRAYETTWRGDDEPRAWGSETTPPSMDDLGAGSRASEEASNLKWSYQGWNT